MELLTLLFIPVGLLLVLGIFLVATYNGLIQKRNMVQNAFSTIDVMLKKRHELIPNLVETVKAFASHESETFEKVIALRSKAMSSDIGEADRLETESQISLRVGEILAIGESYPELKSSDQFLNLQRNLTEIEEQISASRRAYNGAVLSINNAVQTFPSNLVAAKFGFQKHDFFESNEEERAPISVDLKTSE